MVEPHLPTASGGNEPGTDVRSVAAQIEGLLDDSGNIRNDAVDTVDDAEAKPQRDPRGRFTKKAADDGEEVVPDEVVEEPDSDEADLDQAAAGDVVDEDTSEAGDTDEQLADSAIEDAQDSESEDTVIRTVADLAEALEMTREEFLESITDTFGAAGDEVTVTLADQLKGYQKDADYRRQTGELATLRRTAETENAARMQQYEQHNQYLASTLNAVEALITDQLNDPGLAALRERDPAEWTARRTELGQWQENIQATRQQAMQTMQAFQMQQLQETKERELGYLKEQIPDFGTEKATLARETMQSLGYTENEVASTFDHRVVLGVLELAALRSEVAELRAEKAQAKDAVKRLKRDTAPLQKPGKRIQKTSQGIQRDKLAKLRKQAAQSGTVHDAAKVIEQLL